VRYRFPLLVGLILSLTAATVPSDAAKSSTAAGSEATSVAAVDRDLHLPVETNFEYAYIDKTGKVVINGPFATARSFSQGVAVVREKPYEWQAGHWVTHVDGITGHCNMIIDSKGKRLGNSRFEGIEPFSGDYTIAHVRDGALGANFALVDLHGGTTPITKCMQATHYAAGVFAIKPLAEGKVSAFGYMDRSGALVIPYRYAIAGPFSEGLAAVGLERGVGSASLKPGQSPHLYNYCYIDKSADTKIPGPFQEAHPFKGGLAAVCQADKWGFIDPAGKQVVPCQYDWVGDFTGTLAPVEKNNLVGFIDKEGKVAIPFKYKNAESFGEELAPATTDGAHWGFIDSTGAFKIEPTFKRAYTFNSGLALVYIAPRTDIGTRPEEAEYFYETANKLREDGKINEALRNCDVAIKVAPESAWGKRATNLKAVALPDHEIKESALDLLMRGTTCAEKRDFDPAAKFFEQCLQEDPGFIQASGSLAYVLVSQQKYAEAVALLTKTIEKYPNYARGYLRLSQAYEGLGQMEKAQTTLDKARSLAPDDLLIQMYNLTAAPR
jgi:thioredoxin-like negative regulator of GroEL